MKKKTFTLCQTPLCLHREHRGKAFNIKMAQDAPRSESTHRKSALLKHQVQLARRKDSDRYEIVPIPDPSSFEKGFFAVIRAF